MHGSQVLNLLEVSLADHLIQIVAFLFYVIAPAFTDKPVDFKRVVGSIVLINASNCIFMQLVDKAEHPIKLEVLALKVQVHHLFDEVIPSFEQIHYTLLHHGEKLAVVALDQEGIELKLHTLVWLVPVVFQHAFEKFLKINHRLKLRAAVFIRIRNYTSNLKSLAHLLAEEVVFLKSRAQMVEHSLYGIYVLQLD